jgi:deazaflavin-dependent oxidoreductase (nitroreductase family)
MMATAQRAAGSYRAPGGFTRRVFNPTVSWLTERGVSVWGSRVLEVPGRSSGQWRSNPVNPIEVDGRTYLVAPRGETQWVRNLRAAGEGRLRVGNRVSAFTAVELDDADKLAVLRPYLRRWKWEVGQLFDGVGPDSSDAELLEVAPRHPVFAVTVV